MNWRLLMVVGATLCACGEPTVMLVAAGQDLDEGLELDKAQLVEVKVSRALATPNAVRPDSLQPLLGKRLRIPLRKGDLLLASYFEETSRAVAAMVQKKARGVTLSVSGAENLHAGDHVDLLAFLRDPQTNEWIATTHTQNVIVLSPGKLEPVKGDEAFPLRRVTFLLLAEESETALLAVRLGGLHVSLRNEDDIDVMEERGRATANSILSEERRRVLETKRGRIVAEGLIALPRPHEGEAQPPRDIAPVPALPGKQE